MFCLVPDYIPLTGRLIAQGELPGISVWAVAFVQFSLALSYVPAAAAFLLAVGAAEIIRFALSDRKRLSEVVWRAVVIAVAALTLALALSPVIYPIWGNNRPPKSRMVVPWVLGR
jgi:hypothetical protein